MPISLDIELLLGIIFAVLILIVCLCVQIQYSHQRQFLKQYLEEANLRLVEGIEILEHNIRTHPETFGHLNDIYIDVNSLA